MIVARKKLVFEVNQAVRDCIQNLKRVFRVFPDQEVLTRVIKLALIFGRHADKNGIVTIITPDGGKLKIALR